MRRLDTNMFIEKAILRHGNKYLYEKSIYLNRRTKIIITCKDHGDFLQEAGSHI